MKRRTRTEECQQKQRDENILTRADLRLYAVLHRLEMEREREREDSCIKIGSILKNEKVMAHENSRGTEQGAIGCV